MRAMDQWMRGMVMLVFSALAGCSGLTVTRGHSAQERPNDVWVLFTVNERAAHLMMQAHE